MVRYIDSFSGKYRFLSNFFPCEIEFEGVGYRTTEHAFQAAKTTDADLRRPFWENAPHLYGKPLTAGDAKKLGRKLPLRPDWEQVKLSVMEQVLRRKFEPQKFVSTITLRELLLDTGDAVLIEGNTWNDCYWGVCRGEGENHLGRLLMKVRADLFAAAEEKRVRTINAGAEYEYFEKHGFWPGDRPVDGVAEPYVPPLIEPRRPPPAEWNEQIREAWLSSLGT